MASQSPLPLVLTLLCSSNTLFLSDPRQLLDMDVALIENQDTHLTLITQVLPLSETLQAQGQQRGRGQDRPEE